MSGTPVGYKRMSSPDTSDFFERARAVAASVLFAAGAAALIGSFLDWVTVEAVPPEVPQEQAHRLPPFSGLELGDGWAVLGAALVLLLAAFLVVMKGTSGFGWLAFLAAIVIGGIAISDYRGIEEVHLDMEGIGSGPRPGLGLTLVAAAGMIGLIASVGAIAASPSAPRANSED